MKWLDRLPSFKGIASYLYVAAHWSTISADMEAYRHQIKDREEWSQIMLKRQTELHNIQEQQLKLMLSQLEKTANDNLNSLEKAVTDAHGVKEELVNLKGRLQKQRKIFGRVVEEYAKLCSIIAVLILSESPRSRAATLSSLNPASKKLIEALLVPLGVMSSGKPSNQFAAELGRTVLTSLYQLFHGPPAQKS